MLRGYESHPSQPRESVPPVRNANSPLHRNSYCCSLSQRIQLDRRCKNSSRCPGGANGNSVFGESSSTTEPNQLQVLFFSSAKGLRSILTHPVSPVMEPCSYKRGGRTDEFLSTGIVLPPLTRFKRQQREQTRGFQSFVSRIWSVIGSVFIHQCRAAPLLVQLCCIFTFKSLMLTFLPFLLRQTELMCVCGSAWGLIFGAGVRQADTPSLIIMWGLSGWGWYAPSSEERIYQMPDVLKLSVDLLSGSVCRRCDLWH